MPTMAPPPPRPPLQLPLPPPLPPPHQGRPRLHLVHQTLAAALPPLQVQALVALGPAAKVKVCASVTVDQVSTYT
jgi:hypothetical protein